MEEQAKKSVLFLDIHNAVRSQMAEALLKHFRGDKYEVFSAGTEPTDVDPYAIVVMKDIGVDISHYQSKNVQYFNAKHFDYVVSIAASASETRPEYANAGEQLSWDFKDPSNTTGNEQEKLDEYRVLRDTLTQKIQEVFINVG